jgi:hypothetical protein
MHTYNVVHEAAAVSALIAEKRMRPALIKLGAIVNFFRVNHRFTLTKEESEQVFQHLKGSLDAHDLERVCDGLGITLSDTVRTEVIEAYMTSTFSYVTMEDLEKMALHRKATRGKLTPEEYRGWAYRALVGGFPSPTWEEALIYAAQIPTEAERAPFVRKMLELSVDIEDIRSHVSVIKDLNVSDDTYIDILSGLMMSGGAGRQHAADIEHALNLGDHVVAAAYRRAYPIELFKSLNEDTTDTKPKANPSKEVQRWKATLLSLWRRKAPIEVTTAASATAVTTQHPEKVAA